MQKRESSYGISGGVENQLGPLRSAGIRKRYGVHAGSRDEDCKFVDPFQRSLRRLERADPSVAFNVVPDMSGRDGMSRRKRGSADHVLHAFGDQFFVADSVLDRTYRGVLAKDMRDLTNRGTGVDRLGRDDAVVALRQLCGITGRIQTGDEVRRSGKPQAVRADRLSVFFPQVIRPDFDLARSREMSSEQAADSAASDDADLHKINQVTAKSRLRGFPSRCKTSTERRP